MSELKKCPFCGGEARLQRKNKKHGYYVICKKCGCRTPYFQYQFDSLEKLRETAIETWNTRKPVERILERLEEEKRHEILLDRWGNGYGARDITSIDIDKAIEIIKEEVG